MAIRASYRPARAALDLAGCRDSLRQFTYADRDVGVARRPKRVIAGHSEALAKVTDIATTPLISHIR